MSKRALEELHDMLEHELDVLTKKGDITKESLDNFHKLTGTLKHVEELMRMEGYKDEGYSQMPYSKYMPMGGYPTMSYAGGHGMAYDGGQSGNRGGSYDGGTSGGSYDRGGSYDGRRGRDGDSDGRYSEDGSYARGGNISYGRYGRDGSSYEGRGEYSRAGEKERMIQKLEQMMDEAPSDKERKAIMRCINQLDA